MGDRINLNPVSGKSAEIKAEEFSSDGHSPAAILITLSAAVGVVMTGLGIIWPLVPVYAVQLGAGGLQVGIIIASFNLACPLCNPLAGRLSDRWGRKPFIVAGLLLYALVSVFYVMDTLGLPSIFLTGGFLIITGTVLISLFLKGYGNN